MMATICGVRFNFMPTMQLQCESHKVVTAGSFTFTFVTMLSCGDTFWDSCFISSQALYENANKLVIYGFMDIRSSAGAHMCALPPRRTRSAAGPEVQHRSPSARSPRKDNSLARFCPISLIICPNVPQRDACYQQQTCSSMRARVYKPGETACPRFNLGHRILCCDFKSGCCSYLYLCLFTP